MNIVENFKNRFCNGCVMEYTCQSSPETCIKSIREQKRCSFRQTDCFECQYSHFDDSNGVPISAIDCDVWGRLQFDKMGCFTGVGETTLEAELEKYDID